MFFPFNFIHSRTSPSECHPFLHFFLEIQIVEQRICTGITYFCIAGGYISAVGNKLYGARGGAAHSLKFIPCFYFVWVPLNRGAVKEDRFDYMVRCKPSFVYPGRIQSLKLRCANLEIWIAFLAPPLYGDSIIFEKRLTKTHLKFIPAQYFNCILY
jgi:hypothetical protein